MNKLLFLLLLSGLALSGCARHYVVTLSNGSQIDAYGKPKLADGRYHFKNAQGKESELSAGQVRVIAPASMAREEQKTFTPSKPPKQRHWYFLWLAMHQEVGENQPYHSLPETVGAPADLSGGPDLPVFGFAGLPFPIVGLQSKV